MVSLLALTGFCVGMFFLFLRGVNGGGNFWIWHGLLVESAAEVVCLFSLGEGVQCKNNEWSVGGRVHLCVWKRTCLIGVGVPIGLEITMPRQSWLLPLLGPCWGWFVRSTTSSFGFVTEWFSSSENVTKMQCETSVNLMQVENFDSGHTDWSLICINTKFIVCVCSCLTKFLDFCFKSLPLVEFEKLFGDFMFCCTRGKV